MNALCKSVLALFIVTLTAATGPTLAGPPLQSTELKEPKFDGRDKDGWFSQSKAATAKNAKYWHAFGEYHMKQAERLGYDVKNWTNRQKARYLTERMGSKMAAEGMKPNDALLLGDGGGRVGRFVGKLNPFGYRENRIQGTCGDLEKNQIAMFEGGGIPQNNIVSAVVDTGELRSWNVFDVNRRHRAPVVTDDGDPKAAVFDLWKHAKKNDTFAWVDKSETMGESVQKWANWGSREGYSRINCEEHGEKNYFDLSRFGTQFEKDARRVAAERQQLAAAGEKNRQINLPRYQAKHDQLKRKQEELLARAEHLQKPAASLEEDQRPFQREMERQKRVLIKDLQKLEGDIKQNEGNITRLKRESEAYQRQRQEDATARERLINKLENQRFQLRAELDRWENLDELNPIERDLFLTQRESELLLKRRSELKTEVGDPSYPGEGGRWLIFEQELPNLRFGRQIQELQREIDDLKKLPSEPAAESAEIPDLQRQAALQPPPASGVAGSSQPEDTGKAPEAPESVKDRIKQLEGRAKDPSLPRQERDKAEWERLQLLQQLGAWKQRPASLDETQEKLETPPTPPEPPVGPPDEPPLPGDEDGKNVGVSGRGLNAKEIEQIKKQYGAEEVSGEPGNFYVLKNGKWMRPEEVQASMRTAEGRDDDPTKDLLYASAQNLWEAKQFDRIGQQQVDYEKKPDQFGSDLSKKLEDMHTSLVESTKQKHKDSSTESSKKTKPGVKVPPKKDFKCKSNQDCWTNYGSNQYYCNKKKGKCIKCPDHWHGKKDGTAECCRDEPSSGTGGETTSQDKFPKKYSGTILITLPGCSSSQPMTVSLEDHTVGPKNLSIYKYNLVANYGFTIKYDKEKKIGSVEARKLTPNYGYHHSAGRIDILTLGVKGHYTDTKLDGEGEYKRGGVYGNYTVKYQVSLTRQ